jgi:hypothetical protein
MLSYINILKDKFTIQSHTMIPYLSEQSYTYIMARTSILSWRDNDEYDHPCWTLSQRQTLNTVFFGTIIFILMAIINKHFKGQIYNAKSYHDTIFKW